MRLREGYTAAACCKPAEADSICGYYSHNQIMIVHKRDCVNLKKVDPERVVPLVWAEIKADAEYRPDSDYRQLDALDWRVLKHHQTMGVDYSLVVARSLHTRKDIIFERHRKLRGLKLLQRVKPVMMQYRKGVVDNKWIKHRNHTYYELTKKGQKYLEYHEQQETK